MLSGKQEKSIKLTMQTWEGSTDSSCKHDGHVHGVEKLDDVQAMLSTEAVAQLALDWNIDVETLEVNDDSKYSNLKHVMRSIIMLWRHLCIHALVLTESPCQSHANNFGSIHQSHPCC